MAMQDRARTSQDTLGQDPQLSLRMVLFIWFVFSILTSWFAKELDGMSFLGFKLGYYLVVQGSLIVFVVLIVVQNLLQDGIDDAYGQASVDDAQPRRDR